MPVTIPPTVGRVPMDGIELPRLLRSPTSGLGTAGGDTRPTEGQAWPR